MSLLWPPMGRGSPQPRSFLPYPVAVAGLLQTRLIPSHILHSFG